MPVKPFLGKLMLFGGAAGFTGVFFINWCHMVYQCGCTFLWTGGAVHCNIQQAGPPDCPWCARMDLASIAFFAVLGTQALVSFWPGPTKWVRVLAALAASPISAMAVGWIIGWYVGYWI
jgi:hypothetical protein